MLNFTKKSIPDIFYKIAAGGWWLFFIYLIFITYMKGPYLDDWDLIYFTQSIDEGNFTFKLLFEKFTGIHIPVFARLLFAIEYIGFKGANIFANSFCFLTLCASFYLFWRNIKHLTIPDTDKKLLFFTGIFIIFNSAQLLSFNYTWGSFEPSPSVFLALLAIHLFSSDIKSGRAIDALRIGFYFVIGIAAALFIPLGLFALMALLIGLITRRVATRSVLVHLTALVVLLYFFRTENLVFRSGDNLYSMSARDFYQMAGSQPATFFPHFFSYLFAYFGGLINAFSPNAAIGFGFPLACLSAVIAVLLLLKNNKNWIFFQTTLYMMLGLTLATAIGRYQLGITSIDRFYPVYCWLLWALCVTTIILNRKIGMVVCMILFVISLLMNIITVQNYLIRKQDVTQADINIINNSFPHMAHHKISTSLKVFGFDPRYFHDYLKAKKWGIYDFPFDPDLNKLTNDQCEFFKTKEFVVSEKKFVEYQLDGWNLTQNKRIDYIYALDADNKPVAYGESMRRKPGLLPLFFLKRDEVMIYLVAPREYLLRNMRLVGGNGDTLCNITQKN